MRTVDFYFGLGSRYSYLASTWIEALAARAGAEVRWLPFYSQDLMDARGTNPFRGPAPSGQYDPAYRTRDASRWAALYGIPYREPDWAAADWRRLAYALVAAERLGGRPALAKAMFAAAFGEGRPPADDAAIAAVADRAGLAGRMLVGLIDRPETAAAHRAIVEAALGAGVFGVPTFVVDGEAFWGNDRLPLLAHHLGVTG